MSHEITSTDGLVFVGRRAWHGLGVVLPEGPLDPAEAMRVAGLDWPVVTAPLLANVPGAGAVDVPAHRAVVRGDNLAVLDVVSDGFEPVQNRDLFTLLQALDRPVEAAGSLRGGRLVFGLLRQGSFHVGPGDEVRQFLLAVNGHDGSRALTFIPTDVRVECANKLAMAERLATASVHLVHRRGISALVRDAARSLERAEALVSLQRDRTLALADTPWDEGQALEYYLDTATDVLRAPEGTVTVYPGTTTAQYHAEGPGPRVHSLAMAFRAAEGHAHQATLAPTAWRAFQSVSHWAHHVRRGRTDAATSSTVGPVGVIVRRAFRRALDRAGVVG